MTGFYKDYADSSDTHQNSAEASADAAESAKLIAQNAASTATAKAVEATSAAGQAATSASEALVSANNASTSATNASASATNASASATSASASATSASTDADDAEDSATEASASASEAATSLAAQEDLEVTSASFDTTNGTLTLTKANSGTITTDLDGRYAELTGATFTGDVSAPNIGIGTSTPIAPLTIHKDNSEYRVTQDTFISDGTLVSSYNTDTSTYGSILTRASVHRWGIGSDEKMRIDDTGYVGINNNNPSEALDVTGNSVVSGDATVGGELTVTGNAEAELFKGDLEGAVHFKGAKASGATLTKGDVVYVSGYSGGKTVVDLADASDSSKMPAFGIVAADPNGVNVDVVTFGTLKSINTSTYTDGDELYVDTTAGQLTATAPSGEGNLVQKIAKVVRASNSGNIKVMGAGRTNATPNLNDGNIFIGDSNNVATTASFTTEVANATTGKADVSGDTFTGDVLFNDGVKAKFGTDSDLLIYHNNGEPSVIEDAGELGLVLKTNGNIFAVISDTDESMITAVPDEGVSLHYDGTAKVTVGQNAVTIGDDLSVQSGNDLYVQGGDLDVTGDIIVSGTVDGVDIAARDAVLTSTTTTANSAMQDLVDDTSPQLGGNLDLNGNNITGTSNISITQSSTSTPALTISSTATSDVASPTIRLERRSSTTADDDEAGKIEFYGWNEEFSFIPPIQYANITGVLKDVTHASYDGQLDFNLMKDGTSSLTTVMSLTSTALELPNGTDLDVAGDITVGGTVNQNQTTTFGGSIAFTNNTHLMTVDGRDVSVDGARLDTIPYHKIRYVKLLGISTQKNLSTSFQNIGNQDRIRHPSTPVDCSRYLDLDMNIRWNYVSSNVNDLQLQVQLLVPSGGGTTTNIGTVTKSTPTGYSEPSYWAWYYVSGDYTHLFTEFGRINTGTATSEGVVDCWEYNSLTNRTYFLSYNNPGISFNTGQTLYWSPYAFESAGSLLTIVRDIDERYQSNSFQPHHLRFKMAYDDARLEYFVKMKEVSTADSANISITTATLTDIEEV